MQPKKMAKLLLVPLFLAILLGATLGTAYAAPTPQSTQGPSGLFGTVVSVTDEIGWKKRTPKSGHVPSSGVRVGHRVDVV